MKKLLQSFGYLSNLPLISFICFILFFSSNVTSIHAQNQSPEPQRTNFIGASGGEWNNKANWDNGIPKAGVEAYIVDKNININDSVIINANLFLTNASFTINAKGKVYFRNTITVDKNTIAIENNGYLQIDSLNTKIINIFFYEPKHIIITNKNILKLGKSPVYYNVIEFINEAIGTFFNKGKISNLQNYGIFNNEAEGTVYGCGNQGTFNNWGKIEGYYPKIINNSGIFNNYHKIETVLNNTGQFYNKAGSSFYGSFRNSKGIMNEGEMLVYSSLYSEPINEFLSGSTFINKNTFTFLGGDAEINGGTVLNEGTMRFYRNQYHTPNFYINNGKLHNKGKIINTGNFIVKDSLINQGTIDILDDKVKITLYDENKLCTKLKQWNGWGFEDLSGRILIEKTGFLVNQKLIENKTGRIFHYGKMLNSGTINNQNCALAHLYVGSTLNNTGTFMNKGVLYNEITLQNNPINNSGISAKGKLNNTICSNKTLSIGSDGKINLKAQSLISTPALDTCGAWAYELKFNDGLDICYEQSKLLDCSAVGKTIPFTVNAVYSKDTLTCNANLIITDAIKPIISNCPTDINLITTATTAVANWNLPIVKDNCSSPSIFFSHSSGAAFPIGTTTVSYTAQDAAGNSSLCSFKVTVEKDLNNTAGDFCFNQAANTSVSGTTVTLNGILSKSAYVYLFDSKWETIISKQYDTNPISIQTPNAGNYTLKVIVLGNGGSWPPICEKTFPITTTDGTTPVNPCDSDKTPPTFTICPSNITLNTSSNSASLTLTLPTATDNCTPTKVSADYTATTFPLGTTTVTYTAIDAQGNKATCIQKITVVQSQPSSDFCSDEKANTVVSGNNITLNGITNAAAFVHIFDSKWQLVSLKQFNSTPINFQIPTAGDYILKVTVLGKGGTWPPICEKVINVTITLNGTNPCDNDTTAPTLNNCPKDINLTSSTTAAIATWSAPTATDNCSNAPTISATHTSGTAFPIGTTIVTYTATDSKGNKTTCSFNIIVSKAAPPPVCALKSTSPWSYWISKVTFSNMTNSSDKVLAWTQPSELIGYSDFSSIAVCVNPNTAYDLVVQPAASWLSGNLYARAWIDLNKDGDFLDSGELFFDKVTTSVSNPLSAKITMPNIISDKLKMRVIVQYGKAPEPCSPIENGEIEDYSITFGTACSKNDLNTNIESIKIYPNPSAGQVFVELNGHNTENTQIFVSDLLGRIILSEKVNSDSKTLNLENLQDGVYFVRISTNNLILKTEKLIIQH